MRIKTFLEFGLNEMAQIYKKGKTVYADGRKLREVSFKELDDNLLQYREKTGNMMFPKDKTYMYFTDSLDATKKISTGEYDMLLFPHRNRFNMFGTSPISDVWLRKHSKGFKGSEHILGMIEAFTNDDEIYIQMMSVRPGYKHNKINSIMIDSLRDQFPKAKLVFEDPTDDGYLFQKHYAPDAEVKWTGSFRCNQWRKDNPEWKSAAVKESLVKTNTSLSAKGAKP